MRSVPILNLWDWWRRHQHRFLKHTTFDDVPTDAGSRTKLTVYACRCGSAHIFPERHYHQTTTQFKTVLFPRWLTEQHLEADFFTETPMTPSREPERLSA